MGAGTLEGSASVHGYGWVWASVAPDKVEKQQNFGSSSAILHRASVMFGSSVQMNLLSICLFSMAELSVLWYFYVYSVGPCYLFGSD